MSISGDILGYHWIFKHINKYVRISSDICVYLHISEMMGYLARNENAAM